MDVIQTITLVGLGAVLGTAGQCCRVIVGLKKEMAEAKSAGTTASAWFNGKELGLSLLLGATAGALAAVAVFGPEVQITRSLLFGFVGAGYAGADFIGGLMDKWVK